MRAVVRDVSEPRHTARTTALGCRATWFQGAPLDAGAGAGGSAFGSSTGAGKAGSFVAGSSGVDGAIAVTAAGGAPGGCAG